MRPFGLNFQHWCLVLCLLSEFVGEVRAADWPQWGGTNQRNMTSPETRLPTRFDPGKKRRDRLGYDPQSTKNVRWVVRLGSENYSSPTIADGRVFIGTNDAALDDPRFRSTRGGLLKCFDEATGELVWQLVVPRLEIDRSKVSEDFDDMNLGICSTATVDGDRVYIVSNRCEVICLDVRGLANGNDGPFTDEAKFSVGTRDEPVKLAPSDADILWRFDMLRDLPVFPHDAANCSILVHGDFLYVGTANGVYDGKVVLPNAPTLIALNKWNGKLVAKDDSRISPNVFHGQWSSPTLGFVGGQYQLFYGAGDGMCYGFKPLEQCLGSAPTTLQEVWRFDANPPGYRQREGKPIDYWKLVRAGEEEFRADGRLVSPSEIIGTPVFHDSHVYVTIGQDPLHGRGLGALTCIDPTRHGDITTRATVWQYKEIGRSMSSVSIADGLIYAAETTGKIHCLDAKTGELHWIHDTKEEIWSSTFVADGKVYVGTRRGLVVLVAGRKPGLLADIKLGSAVWSVPSAANGVLYVASQRNLWAVEEKHEMREISQ
jgi:outer membrane protein assembly factor BamB